jgi:2-amino-4-hydroxy-6-hydroxymethyldihydropteridine diphosphokinase
MSQCLIGLGSNQDDRRSLLEQAIAALARHPQFHDLRASRFHATQPVGGPAGQPEFLNAAVRCETSLSPHQVLALLQGLEHRLGRIRTARWGPRRIDLDLLLLDDVILQSPDLRVPHPRMAFRRFVLEPAAEVAGDMVHPEIGWSIGRLLDHLRSSFCFLSIGGRPCRERSQLAADVAAGAGGRLLRDAEDDRQLVQVCGESTGPTNEAALEFVARRAAMLTSDRWSPDGVPVVSDFSYDQMLAIGICHLPAASLEAWRRSWTHWRQRVVQPVLLALWDGPPESAGGEALRAESDRVIARWHEGPVLRLGRTSMAEAIFELTAAVRAMS